ncbi:MAG: hypothetical protein HY906_20265 [Deltaproteobacteria bacterium]|nr:hypothetical protein [Deltaproteobacteria bacterium]
MTKDRVREGGARRAGARSWRLAVALLAAAGLIMLVAALASRAQSGGPADTGGLPVPAAGAPVAVTGPVSGGPAAGPASGPTARTARPRVEVAFRAAWGSGPADLGHTRPQEGNPEGPMSFAVDRGGRVLVLDQVNSRVQIFAAGKVAGSVPLPADTFQDIEARPDGAVVLLDRLGRRAVVFAEAGGRVTGEVPLVGAGVAEGGGVTGLFQRDDGTWVEVEHRDLVRIADAGGRGDPNRPITPGRPTGDGRAFLRAALDGREAAVVLRQARDAAAFTPLARVTFPAPILHLSALESDRQGRIFLAAALLRRLGDEGSRTDEAEVVAILGPDGADLGRVTLPPRLGPEEVFRPIRLGADGNVYQMSWDESGVTMRRILP